MKHQYKNSSFYRADGALYKECPYCDTPEEIQGMNDKHTRQIFGVHTEHCPARKRSKEIQLEETQRQVIIALEQSRQSNKEKEAARKAAKAKATKQSRELIALELHALLFHPWADPSIEDVATVIGLLEQHFETKE